MTHWMGGQVNVCCSIHSGPTCITALAWVRFITCAMHPYPTHVLYVDWLIRHATCKCIFSAKHILSLVFISMVQLLNQDLFIYLLVLMYYKYERKPTNFSSHT